MFHQCLSVAYEASLRTRKSCIQLIKSHDKKDYGCVQMMPGCLPLIAAILMQKFPGSVKLTCPKNQCHIMMRLTLETPAP
jgi:hypothetical protein